MGLTRTSWRRPDKSCATAYDWCCIYESTLWGSYQPGRLCRGLHAAACREFPLQCVRLQLARTNAEASPACFRRPLTPLNRRLRRALWERCQKVDRPQGSHHQTHPAGRAWAVRTMARRCSIVVLHNVSTLWWQRHRSHRPLLACCGKCEAYLPHALRPVYMSR